MNSKTVYFISFVIFILGVLLGVMATYSYLTLSPVDPIDGGIACTMEAKICPDGSSVGRTGPNCEFEKCPSSGTTGTVGTGGTEPIDSTGGNTGAGTILPGDGGGGVACTMDAKICPDGSSVGRVGPNCEFAECPILGAQGSLCSTNSDCGSGYECIDTSPVIREGEPANLRCWKIGSPRPICLSGNTRIGTPNGDVLVKDMKVGTGVWTVDKNGKKVFGTVILAGKTRVPGNHKVMHIKLSDGRELLVSPGHKIADGRKAGEIMVKSVIDGATVVLASLISYGEEYTYDILSSGDTGIYFANGILLRSTLR
ncbi:MAG: Hint domain-containing protein [Candidatus Paceibacterota bacterium]